MYFLKIKKDKPGYSLPTMIVAFLNMMEGNTSFLIDNKDIDLGRGLEIDVPLQPNNDGVYNPMINFDTLSKISNFSYPKRVIQDFRSRTKTFPKKILGKDVNSDRSLSLLKPFMPNNHSITGATWYTAKPIPYSDWMIPYMEKTPLCDHDKLLAHLWFLGEQNKPDEFEMSLNDNTFAKFARDNPELFQKSKDKRKEMIEQQGGVAQFVEANDILLGQLDPDGRMAYYEEQLGLHNKIEEKNSNISIDLSDDFPEPFKDAEERLFNPGTDPGGEEYESDSSEDENDFITRILDKREEPWYE
jgi:hypothetical protein